MRTGKGRKKSRPVRRVIVVDPRRCLACRTCEIECAVAHSRSKELLQAMAEEVPPRPRVTLEWAEGFAVPLQCRHCEDAPCVAVCPTGALSRENEESPVLVNGDLCIGCRSCILACPFGVISMAEMGERHSAIIKCDLCVERLAAGRLPACVEGCPTGALSFRELGEVAGAARKRAAKELIAAGGSEQSGGREAS